MARKKREPIGQSIRWQVFARDGFCCRYCGKQAGQNGVVLVVDHMVSLADGGDDRYDNLLTACLPCNAGKSAKSINGVPTSAEVVERQTKMTARMEDAAESVRRAGEAQRELEQEIVDLKCRIYGNESVEFTQGEMTYMIRLVDEFGAAAVVEWYTAAASRRVPAYRAYRYVCGCAKQAREKQGLANG